MALQLLDFAAYRALGQAQRICCQGEAACVGDFDQGLHILQLRHVMSPAHAFHGVLAFIYAM